MKSEKRYLLVENNKETGPFTTSQINARIAAGEIFSDTVCIPKSLFGIPAPLGTFFPNTNQRPVNSTAPLDIDKVHAGKKWNLSKLDYLGIGVCAILIVTGSGENVLLGIILACLFFGKRVYLAAKQTSSEIEFVEIGHANNNSEDTKELDWAVTARKTMVSAARKIQEDMNAAREFVKKRNQYIESIKRRSTCKPVEVVILGGAGWENAKDSECMFSMDATSIYMSDLKTLIDTTININDLREIEISGPGKVTTNAGVLGGGFGAEGALKGMAIATVINILTTYSNTKTFIRLGFQSSEIVMLTSKIEPDKARILLSSLFLKANRKPKEEKTLGVSDEIHKLHELKQNGAITALQFEKLKDKLIG